MFPIDQAPTWLPATWPGRVRSLDRQRKKTDAASEPCRLHAPYAYGRVAGPGAATGNPAAAAVFCTARFPHSLVFRTNYQTHMPGSHSTWARNSLVQIKLSCGKLVT